MDINQGSSHNSTRDSQLDEKEIISDLLKLAPFQYTCRSHDSFKDIKRIPHKYLDVVSFHQWFEQSKTQWSVVNMEYNNENNDVENSDVDDFHLLSSEEEDFFM